MRVNIRSDVNKTIKQFGKMRSDQIPFATAMALTRTAQAVQRDQTAQLDKDLDRPTPFTKRAYSVKRATKRNLTAIVFAKPIQDAYLSTQVEGGTRLPKNKKIPVPANIKLNQYGNMPRRKVATLLKRRDTFIGEVRGLVGLWQRTKAGGVKLLVNMAAKAEYKPQLRFHQTSQATIDRVFQSEFEKSLRQAIASAR